MAICGSLVVGAGASTSAQATTGDADGLPPPKILVNTAIGDRYIGRFYLSRIERRAGLVSAVLDVDYTESVVHDFMVGDGQFYQYNQQGQLTSWTASLYPYVYAHGLMSCNLLVPGTTNKLLGKLVLEKPSNLDTPAHPNQEVISGRLTIGSSTYAATFAQAEDDLPTPSSLPRAVQVGAAAGSTASPPSPASAEAVSSEPPEGVFASVVHYAGALG